MVFREVVRQGAALVGHHGRPEVVFEVRVDPDHGCVLRIEHLGASEIGLPGSLRPDATGRGSEGFHADQCPVEHDRIELQWCQPAALVGEKSHHLAQDPPAIAAQARQIAREAHALVERVSGLHGDGDAVQVAQPDVGEQ